MKTPRIYTPESIIESNVSVEIQPGKWVAARAMSYPGLNLFTRFKCAWMVFTGKADVVKWIGQ